MDNNTNTASTTEQQRNNSEVLLLSLEDNKYANLDESQLEEFAKIASPKVSKYITELQPYVCSYDMHFLII